MAKPQTAAVETEALSTTKEVVESVQATLPSIPTKPAFKVVKNVTLPVLQIKQGEPVYCKILDKIFTGKEIPGKEGAKKMAPAQIVVVESLVPHPDSGEYIKGQIVLGTVLVANLRETYPEDGYVGKQFQIVKHGKRAGKDYNDYSITEIEME